VGQVLDGGHEPRVPLVVLRARLPPVRNLVARGANLVRTQLLEHLAPAEQDAEVRPERLVRGAHEQVGLDRAGVDQPVLGEVHPVAHDDRAHVVSPPGQLGGGGDRADRVGGQRERDDLGSGAERRVERVQVERGVVVSDIHPSHRGARVLRGHDPGADVGVVVQRGDHDLVAGPEGPGHGPGHGEQQRRRVRAEQDLTRVAPQQVRPGPVGLLDQAVGLGARGEGPVGVRVAGPKV